MLKKWLTIIFCFFVINTFSQTSNIIPLSIGDKVPDVIFKNIKYHNSSTASLSDFKGKLIILDFWSTFCSTCIAAFPKMEKLQKQFDGEIQIILVNCYEDELKINERLKKINKNRIASKLIKLPELPALFSDSILIKFFPHETIPHHVWIDREGRILAITYDYYATSENVQQMLDGKKVKFAYKDDFIDYSMKRDGILKPALSSFKPAFYSSIMPYDPVVTVSNGASGISKDSANGTIRMYRPNNTIFSLYYEAFSVPGKRTRLIFEVKNWGAFEWPGVNNATISWLTKNLFSYELFMQEKFADKMRKFMQDDLNRFFGGLYGIEGNLEKRALKSLVLIQSKEGLLKSKGEKKTYESNDSLRRYINYPFRSISRTLEELLEDMSRPIAFIDETGYTGNADIQFNGDMRNLQNARKQLQQYGLDIIETEREVEVVVIKDKHK
jgi:thiol-disulfide isomerase/thioredoxin